MGTFHVAIELGSLDGSRWEFVEALVDTGASHSIFPASLLRQLGIEPTERWPFRLADGGLRELDIGEVQVRVGGRQCFSIVAFGGNDEAVLGRLSLDELGLGVDLAEATLRPVPGYLVSVRHKT